MSDDLTRREDLSDPAVLRTQCEEFAAGMEQQAIASNHRNAFQGHPQPGFFFGRAAAILKAAAEFVRQHQPDTIKPPDDKPDPKATDKKK